MTVLDEVRAQIDTLQLAADRPLIISDADEVLVRQYIEQSCFVDNRLNQFVDPENVLARFDDIFQAQGIQPVAQTWRGKLSAFKRRKYVRGALYRLNKLVSAGQRL